MGYTSAWPYLHKKRPTASLMSKKVLVSLIGHIIINSSFQFAMYFYIRTQAWYSPPNYDPDGENIECFENTVLFLLSCYQYILVAVVFSVGPPYRQPVWSNGKSFQCIRQRGHSSFFLIIYRLQFDLSLHSLCLRC